MEDTRLVLTEAVVGVIQAIKNLSVSESRLVIKNVSAIIDEEEKLIIQLESDIERGIHVSKKGKCGG